VSLPAEASSATSDLILASRDAAVDVDAWKPFGCCGSTSTRTATSRRTTPSSASILDDQPMGTGFGPDLELALDANGVTYTDDATFE
jgi:hypothetical protein